MPKRTTISVKEILSSKVGHLNRHLLDQPAAAAVVKVPKPRKNSREMKHIVSVLMEFSQRTGYKLEKEYRFHDRRKFRFDFCFPEIKLAIEYNGIMSEKSRHTSVTGYSMDMNKLNLAQSEGFTVLQYTPLNHKNITNDLKKYEHETQNI